VAVLLSGVALLTARRQSKRLERMTESYWELRYELGQLRARVNRLEPGPEIQAAAEPPPANFIPLSSLKR